MNALDLADQLVRGARAPLHRAALTLLLGLTGLYDRVDVVGRWYHWPIAAAPRYAVVKWERVAADADRGRVPMSPGERSVLLVAASLADGHRVDLAATLPLIDDAHAANLVLAIATLRTVAPELDPRALGHLALNGQADR